MALNHQAAIAAGAALEEAMMTTASFGGDNHAFINGYPSPTLSIHRSVTCDECGQSPLRGTRFMSTRQPNYDVCAQCLHENHGGSTRHFTVLRHPRALVMMAREPESGARSVTVYSFYELIDVLEGTENHHHHNDGDDDDDDDNSDDTEPEPPGTVADITMHVGTRTPREVGLRARRALASHTGLKSVHLNVFGTSFATDIIEILCDGLSQNRSVATVAWTIPAELSPEAARALQNLMLNNRETMKFLFVQQKAAYVGWQHQQHQQQQQQQQDLPAEVQRVLNAARPRDRPRANTTTSSTSSSTKKETPKSLEDLLFDALVTTTSSSASLSSSSQSSSLHTFRFQGIRPVSDSNKQKAWQAMQTNPNLRRIKATFQNDDYQLELLTLDKKHRWTERWVQKQSGNYGPTAEPTPMPPGDDERWTVLEEALALTSETALNSDDSESDTDHENAKLHGVAVLYHFLRYQPAFLLECVATNSGRVPVHAAKRTPEPRHWHHSITEPITEMWV